MLKEIAYCNVDKTKRGSPKKYCCFGVVEANIEENNFTQKDAEDLSKRTLALDRQNARKKMKKNAEKTQKVYIVGYRNTDNLKQGLMTVRLWQKLFEFTKATNLCHCSSCFIRKHRKPFGLPVISTTTSRSMDVILFTVFNTAICNMRRTLRSSERFVSVIYFKIAPPPS